MFVDESLLGDVPAAHAFPVNWLHMVNKKYASHFQGGQVPPLPMPMPMPAGANV